MSDFNAEHNLIVWSDIAVMDLERAVNFYSQVLDKKFEIKTVEDNGFAVSEHDQGNGVCLVLDPENVSNHGPLLYFNVGSRIEAATDLVLELGGTIDQPVTPIGEYGFRSVVLDSEGNRIGLHARA
jgi:predicted enzyme related to lactoylglutathione lyase